MVDLFPNHAESVTELHQQWLDDIPEGAAKDQGVRAGNLAAEAILEKRESDGYDSAGEFTPRDEPGSNSLHR